ncbi:MAG: SPOR domain-containing protein, partial [Magnetococcales bacterium]|nr:SPOR domain-containing protein [Magnetococcales bacterium]
PEGKGEPPPPASKTVAIKQQPRMFVQLGAFQDQGNAQKLAQRLRPFGEVKIAPTQVGNKQFYRVRLVTGSSAEEADALVDRLESKGFPGGQIVVD